MTTLHERLADLAEHAPSGAPAPDLWDRGRRAARRQRLGTVAIVAVVILAVVALGTADWLRSRPALAPANGAPALPDRIWAPSRWLPGTDDAGELGQLAAVKFAERGGWTGSDEGVVGISATTGEYRFLDLPDRSSDAVALAPDGRHVAYWYTGETRQSPNSGSGPVVGVAVYDTTTGDVVHQPVETDHGLWVEDLLWADADRLVFHYLQFRGGDGDDDMAQSSGDNESGLLVWLPGVDEPTPIRVVGGGPEIEASTGHGQLLLDNAGPLVWFDLDDPDHWRSFGMSSRMGQHVSAVNDDGTLVASVLGSRSPNSISVARVRHGEPEPAVPVPNTQRTFSVWQWLDRDHVAAVQYAGSKKSARRLGFERFALFSVDVITGERQAMIRLPHNDVGASTVLATDLLDRPVVTRSEPPHPWDPRAVAAGEVLLLGGGLVALVLWRRRRVDA